MKAMRVLLLVPFLVAACQRTPQPAASASIPYAPQKWLLPSSPGAAEPDLAATRDGRLLLSWIDRVPGRRAALQFAAFGDDGHWQSAPRTIAVGESLLADAADVPHITATEDGAMWVHWMQKAGDVAGASNLMLSRSADGGFNWGPPVQINQADSTEHGFAALWPAARDSIGLAWLDGRGGTPSAQHAAHASDATSLHAARFDANLQRMGDATLDTMVCDCCETAIAATPRGAVLVYRDRTAAEVRDIFAVRFDGTKWTSPRPVHGDHWIMPACPVNGPAIAANANTLVAAWYTGANDDPTVQLARSRDAGASFDPPVVLDHGAAVQGRVAVAMDAKHVWVSWLREDAGGQSLWLARYTPDLSRQLQKVEVARLHGRGRATGFPQLALRDGDAYLVWTDVIDGAPQLQGARLSSD